MARLACVAAGALLVKFLLLLAGIVHVIVTVLPIKAVVEEVLTIVVLSDDVGSDALIAEIPRHGSSAVHVAKTGLALTLFLALGAVLLLLSAAVTTVGLDFWYAERPLTKVFAVDV